MFSFTRIFPFCLVTNSLSFCGQKTQTCLPLVLNIDVLFSILSGLPRFSSQPGASSVTQGDSVVLNCDINVDLVPFTRWELDQEPLDLDERVVKLPNGTLVISNASEADAGLYRCVVENVGPVKTSDEAELQVLPGTSFRGRPLLLVLCKSEDRASWI